MTSVGFLVYGPQVLVGVAAADFASKRAVGMAVGLTGTFGYIGSAISGVCIGWIADNYGWDGGFIFFIISAMLACVCFALTWNGKAKVLDTSME
jgi:sugar phosphate permease